jgi:Eukaryotic membrane protein family
MLVSADIVERFQLTLMLFAIALRNLIELSSSEGDFSTNHALLPVAFRLIPSSNLIWNIFFVSLAALTSTCCDLGSNGNVAPFPHSLSQPYWLLSLQWIG